ncbi:MAG: MBG domain-containing protein, partial [Erysipelotrichaceae bacterium]|nr:MBG domain-containing protein [Erysipelotrichaceae bacterium]
ATLAISSLSSGINHVLAQAEKEVQENIIEKEEVVEKKARILEEKEESQTKESTTGEVEINDTNFPDYDFSSYIREQFDSNRDGILSREELNNVTKIDLANYRYRGGIWSVEGIEHFPNLQELDCYETSITSIDISKNQALTYLRVAYTDITSIDVSQNPGLKVLIVYETPLTSIDVSKNIALVNLLVWRTNITSLDVSNNPELYQLDFYETSITSIDVSNNPKLESIRARDTLLTGLDVTNNPLLSILDIKNNNLAWLDIGNSSKLSSLGKSDSTINLGEIYNTFNIQERFPGIDPNKIISIEGAEIDKTTGVVSGYDNGTPIRYTYDCGIARGNEITLNVTLNFTKVKRQSSITINDNLNKEYDGEAVAEPTDIVKIGTGNVTFEWFRQNEDGSLESLGNQAPINVGNYGVKAHIAANEDYEAADSGEPTPFEITQAQSNITINSYDNKEWDGKPVSEPTAITRTQNNATVIFKYYRANDTTTEIPAPSEVGEYKVKAFLSGDANYTDSESDFYDFSITAVGTTITLTYADQIYTGNPVVDPQKDVHYTVEGSTGGGTIEWYAANDLTTPLAQAPTNVGSYVVKVSVEATATHAGASATETFQITPATSTVSINRYEGK